MSLDLPCILNLVIGEMVMGTWKNWSGLAFWEYKDGKVFEGICTVLPRPNATCHFYLLSRPPLHYVLIIEDIDIIFGFPASIVLSRYIWISREQRGSIYSGFPRDCFKQCYHLYKFRIITRFVQIQLAVITDIAGNLCCACKSFSSTICLDFRAIVFARLSIAKS
ncbi:hypothetical protein BJ912DRAFT_936318 [Pholiota molesta]|nr:hypothetical protein BJ912DRAFT_936318 [Pholiota molesta]